MEAADFLKAHQLYGGLEALRALYNENRLRYFTNYQNWKSFLGQMDFVFGARMHGLAAAVHAGVPAHFIAHDSRVREMCEFFKLPSSSEQSLASTGFAAEDIYNRTDYSEVVNRYPKLYRNFIQFLIANQITPNCDAELQIAEAVDCSPASGVEVEQNPATDSAIHRRFANVLFDLGESIARQGRVEGYERLVQICSQLWHEELTMHPLAKPQRVMWPDRVPPPPGQPVETRDQVPA